MKHYDGSIKTAFGHVALKLEGDALCALDQISERLDVIAPASVTAGKLLDAISAYCHDASTMPHDIKLSLQGTPFAQRVWRALQAIPCGDVMSYGELAKKLGTSARAIGNACRRNPVPLIIPCHRVVAANGIGGYCGHTGGAVLEIKRKLLQHEGARIA